MKNSEIIRKMEEIQACGAAQTPQGAEPAIRFLVFQAGDRMYALFAEQVREICLDLPLFFIPFVPRYVRGFINRHGEPYTVLDINVLFGQDPIVSSTCLIVNLKEDQLAFIISGVREIVKVPAGQVHQLTSHGGTDAFFRGSISLQEQEIFILSLANVIDRLENDLEG